MEVEDKVRSIHLYLGISEIEIFGRAYVSWWGVEADPDELEIDYANYMFRGKVPFYLTHYLRTWEQEEGVFW